MLWHDCHIVLNLFLLKYIFEAFSFYTKSQFPTNIPIWKAPVPFPMKWEKPWHVLQVNTAGWVTRKASRCWCAPGVASPSPSRTPTPPTMPARNTPRTKPRWVERNWAWCNQGKRGVWWHLSQSVLMWKASNLLEWRWHHWRLNMLLDSPTIQWNTGFSHLKRKLFF